MLPDSTQARSSDNPAKFADTGIPLMINDVVALGATKARLVAKLAGGAAIMQGTLVNELAIVGGVLIISSGLSI